jgi:hypothetical protein
MITIRPDNFVDLVSIKLSRHNLEGYRRSKIQLQKDATHNLQIPEVSIYISLNHYK